MNNQFKLSEKDRKLLFLLLSLIVIAGSYFLIYTKNISKAAELNISNQTLQVRVSQLEGMQAEAENKQIDIERFQKRIEYYHEKFPVIVNTEDTIVLVNELEEYAGMKVSSVSFVMNEVFYPSAESAAALIDSAPQASPVVEGSTTETATETTATTPAPVADTTTPATNPTTEAASLTGYMTTITLAYQTNYEGIKKAIQYINQNPNRMTMGDLSATFDSSTGNLMGSMSINIYSLVGPEIDKTYDAPIINNINTGLDNIFGTIEIQKEQE